MHSTQLKQFTLSCIYNGIFSKLKKSQKIFKLKNVMAGHKKVDKWCRHAGNICFTEKLADHLFNKNINEDHVITEFYDQM